MSETSLTTTVLAPPDDAPFWDSPLHIPLRIPRRDITVTGPPGNRTIHYSAFVLGADGQILVDPDDEDEPLTEERTTPCLAEPSAAVTKEVP